MKNENILAWLLVAANAGAIFYFSSQTGEKSSEVSSEVTETVMENVETVNSDYRERLEFSDVHSKVRKNAHFTLYLMFGYLLFHAMKKENNDNATYALLACALVAMMDESYQYFVPGRSAEVFDVMLDSAGAATGISINHLLDNYEEPIKQLRKK